MVVALKDMPLKVLVTGAGGFVGHHLIAALDKVLAPGSEIVAGYSKATASAPVQGEGVATRIGVRAVGLDVTDDVQVSGILRAERPTHVVHLAAIAAVTAATRDPRMTWNVNLNGTLNIALSVRAGVGMPDRLQRQFRDLRRQLQGRPAARRVVGTPAGQPLCQQQGRGRPDAGADGPARTEGHKAAAVQPHGSGTERGLRDTVLRGADRPDRAGLSEPAIRVGSLDAMRDFLDVHDVVDAYVAAVLRADDLPVGCVMNLASGQPRRIGDMLDSLLAMSDTRIEVTPDPARFRPSDTPWWSVTAAGRMPCSAGSRGGISKILSAPFSTTGAPASSPEGA